MNTIPNNNEQVDQSNHTDVEDESGELGIESKGKRIVRTLIALVLVLALLNLSGIRDYFLYHETPQQTYQEPIESLLDAEVITIPLYVYIFRGSKPYGSDRTDENAQNLVTQASKIWHQADIRFEVASITTTELTDDSFAMLMNSPGLFIAEREFIHPGAITVFLVGTYGGINGISFGGDQQNVLIADYTTTHDFRTLAHEIGHELSLDHVSQEYLLMHSGSNGVEMTLEEIMQAREYALQELLTQTAL